MSWGQRLPCLLLFSAIIAPTFGCRESSRSSSRAIADSLNVLIITLDTTRADRLGCYGYARARTPNLDKLAREGVQFTHAYSPVPLTLPAHCSIFTGAYPPSHLVRNNGTYFLLPEAETLAEILKSKGYATAAFVASFILDSRFGLDQGFAVYDDDLGNGGRIKTLASERRAAEVYDCFSRWFAARPANPFLVWVHFFDPHLPYDPPEPFKSDSALLPYDGEIANVDVHVGKILDLLSAEGIIDRTLIIAAGDHGEGFGEHGETGHGVFCYGEAVNVPLILRAPRRLPSDSVSRAPVNLVDIVPTVLEFLKSPISSDVQGIPLQRQLKKPMRSGRPLFMESVFLSESLGCAPVKGVIDRGFKYLRLPRPELYDLTADPEERINLVVDQAVVARTLRQRLERFEQTAGRRDASAHRRMSAEEKARLESLGYLAGESAPAAEAGLADPKDIIRAWTLFQSGERLLEAGQTSAAEEKFQAAVQENRRTVNAYSSLADIYGRRGDVAALEKILAEGIAANPRNGTLRLRQLFYLFQLGRTEAVLERLAETEPLVPYWQREQFYNLAGIACGRAGRYTLAAAYLEKVLAIEPADAAAAKNLGYALFMQGRYAEALTYQQLAEKGLPQDSQLAAETAATLAKQRDYAAAGRYYEKALRLQPAEGVVLQYAGMLAEQRDYTCAVALLKSYAERPAASSGFREKARRLIGLWQRR